MRRWPRTTTTSRAIDLTRVTASPWTRNARFTGVSAMLQLKNKIFVGCAGPGLSLLLPNRLRPGYWPSVSGAQGLHGDAAAHHMKSIPAGARACTEQLGLSKRNFPWLREL